MDAPDLNQPAVDLLGTPVNPDAPVIGLRAFWVGEYDTFAAHSPEHALELCREQGDTDTDETYSLVDVTAVNDVDLDKPIFDEDRKHCGNLREALAAADQPGFLMGFE